MRAGIATIFHRSELAKGLPQGSPVEVSFRYDKSGRIQMQAVELSSQTKTEISIQRNVGFDQLTVEELADAVSQLAVE